MQNDAFIRNSEIGQSTDYANSILGFAIGNEIWKALILINTITKTINVKILAL